MSSASSSQVPGDAGGTPASSLSQQTQPLRIMPPSLSANVAAQISVAKQPIPTPKQNQAPSPSSFSTTTTTTIPTQEQPQPHHQQQLFPKPHQMFPPTTTTNTPAIATPSSMMASSPPLSTAAPAAMAVLSATSATSAPTTTTTKSLSSTTISPTTTTHLIPQNPMVVSSHSTSNNPHFVKGEGVTEPLPTDVICGRGKMTASHPANRRFRELVDSHKAAYQNSKRRDEKTRITCELVDQLRAEGRFVLFDPHTKLWHEVSEEYAREKVSHSLRSRSSHEQKIATAASNSIKMLNNAVQQHPPPRHENNNNSTTSENSSNSNTAMVTIAPRTAQGSSSKRQPLASTMTPQSSKLAQGPSTPHHTPTTTKSTKAKSGGSSHSKSSKTSASPRKKSTSSPSSKTTPSGHKTTRSKHLKPGLDEIVQRLIKDQQSLLRAMIQKETERFTSAAAMSGVSSHGAVGGAAGSGGSSSSHGATRAMPLSYKAEASAVSKLTASLPKMGKPLTEASRMVTAEVEAPRSGHPSPAPSPPSTTATPATAATTTANA